MLLNKLTRIVLIIHVFLLALLRPARLMLWAKPFKKDIYLGFWLGELGNNIIQIAQAEYVSKRVNLTLHVPLHKFIKTENGYLTHTIDVDRRLNSGNLTSTRFLADLKSGSNRILKSERSLARNFFYQYDISPYKPSLADYREILKNRVLPLIPDEKNNSVSDETLVIHIRSGDIFKGEFVHSGYVQPPLSFYLKIIKEFDFKDIVVVTQSDLNNPCIHRLKQLIPNIRIQALSLMEDVSTILSAKNLVVGMSSFSLALSFSSENIKNLYLPQFDVKQTYWRIIFWSTILRSFISSELNFSDLDFKVHPIKMLNYIPVGGWKNTQEQLDLMINHPQEFISLD